MQKLLHSFNSDFRIKTALQLFKLLHAEHEQRRAADGHLVGGGEGF